LSAPRRRAYDSALMPVPRRLNALCLMLIASACGHRVPQRQDIRREVVRVQHLDGTLTVHTPPRVRPVEISDAELRSAMLTAVLHWPISLETGQAAVGRRLLLVSVEVESAGQRSLLEGYAEHCERRRSPGDCYTLLDDGPGLDAKDVRSLAVRIALAQALQLAFETLRDIDAEAIKATLASTIGAYVAMWLLPEPISKFAALAFTAAMVAYVGTDVFWAIRDGFAELKANLETARTFDDVSAAGELLGRRLGPSLAKVIVLVASFAAGGALAKMPVPKLPGGPGAVANATTQGLVLSSLQSITVVPGSLTFAVGATSAGGLLMMATTSVGDGRPEPSSGSTKTAAAGDSTIADLLQPDGKLIGQAGSSSRIRILKGGQAEAEILFRRLSSGGELVRGTSYPGSLVRLPGGGQVGFRPTSKSGPPTIDVFIEGIGIREIKFLP
jgi:hypothetical protein